MAYKLTITEKVTITVTYRYVNNPTVSISITRQSPIITNDERYLQRVLTSQREYHDLRRRLCNNLQ